MANQVNDLITRSLEKAKVLLRANHAWSRTLPATPFDDGIPTLEPGKYQAASPHLRERFARFGRWEWATHGHWLSVEDMQSLWSDETPQDQLLSGVQGQLSGIESGWTNSAPALFKRERLTLFAGSDLNYEAVYLLWLECEDEPEVWVYDPNGESRYKDLAQYLQAYLDDDVSAAQRRWKLAEVEQFGQ